MRRKSLGIILMLLLFTGCEPSASEIRPEQTSARFHPFVHGGFQIKQVLVDDEQAGVTKLGLHAFVLQIGGEEVLFNSLSRSDGRIVEVAFAPLSLWSPSLRFEAVQISRLAISLKDQLPEYPEKLLTSRQSIDESVYCNEVLGIHPTKHITFYFSRAEEHFAEYRLRFQCRVEESTDVYMVEIRMRRTGDKLEPFFETIVNPPAAECLWVRAKSTLESFF